MELTELKSMWQAYDNKLEKNAATKPALPRINSDPKGKIETGAIILAKGH
ncbi:MAG: hypothetical protein WDO71_00325 [Bacteroidota bacterium]